MSTTMWRTPRDPRGVRAGLALATALERSSVPVTATPAEAATI